MHAVAAWVPRVGCPRTPDLACLFFQDHFRDAGNVLHADVVMDPEGKSRGFGTVRSGTTKHNSSLHQPHPFTSPPSPYYINITSPPPLHCPHPLTTHHLHRRRCSSPRHATRPRPSSSSTRVSSVAAPSKCGPTSSRDADATACPRSGAEVPPNGAGVGCVRLGEARRLGVAPRRGAGGRMGDSSRRGQRAAAPSGAGGKPVVVVVVVWERGGYCTCVVRGRIKCIEAKQ